MVRDTMISFAFEFMRAGVASRDNWCNSKDVDVNRASDKFVASLTDCIGALSACSPLVAILQEN
jgi:hypothetical protein